RGTVGNGRSWRLRWRVDPHTIRRPALASRDNARFRNPPRAVGARSMNKLHVEIAGSGPPLVLLHGWAMHGGIFAPLVEALRAHRTLHVVDLPGHGHSRDSGVPLALDACGQALLEALPVAPWCG